MLTNAGHRFVNRIVLRDEFNTLAEKLKSMPKNVNTLAAEVERKLILQRMSEIAAYLNQKA